MRTRATNRMAPPRYARSPQEVPEAVRGLWRDLRCAFVPDGGSGTATGGGMREWLRNTTPSNNYLQRVVEANGPAASTTGGNGLGFSGVSTYIPQTGALTVVAFLVRRDSSTSIQTLTGTGYLGASGWSFHLNAGSGQLGFTRWGIADNPSTSLGAVPNSAGTASVVGVSYDGSNLRYCLNGRFETVASGSINTATGGVPAIARNANSIAPLLNTSLHVVYVWARALSDQEMLALVRDPWAPLRPKVHRSYPAAAASGGTGTGGYGTGPYRQWWLPQYNPHTGTMQTAVQKAHTVKTVKAPAPKPVKPPKPPKPPQSGGGGTGPGPVTPPPNPAPGPLGSPRKPLDDA